jgi:hypothetical protein
MIRFYLFIALAFFLDGLCAQSISNQVLASSGNHFSGANHQLSWTLGEPVISTFSVGNSVLTQGFHQPYNQVFTSVNSPSENLALQVFPNPCEANLTIKFSSTATVEVNLCDVLGKQLLSHSVRESQNAELDMSVFAHGIYLLEVKSSSGQLLQLIKILKN